MQVKVLNPRTYKGGEGGWGGGEVGRWFPLPSDVFLSFLLEEKTSSPDVFSTCSFIPRIHFETSLVMVSYYGYEICRHKWQADNLLN